MSTIPHDSYIRLTDPKVYYETLRFHTQGNFCLHKATQNLTKLHSIRADELQLLTGNELRYNLLDENIINDKKINPLTENSPLLRNRSCDFFSNKSVTFDTLMALMSPLAAVQENSSHRGYPSGGALYPIDVFCCRVNSTKEFWPEESDILHLLPNSLALEAIKPTRPTAYLKEAILPYEGEIGTPYCAIIYMAYLPKTLFKYKSRGYRLALMEVGSMYMLVDLQCKALGLKNRIWSGYTDCMVTNALSVNPALALPLCVQFIGY
jgi:SagB-type dehydrogenase family enzyme